MRKGHLYALCHISTVIPILNWRKGERERELCQCHSSQRRALSIAVGGGKMGVLFFFLFLFSFNLERLIQDLFLDKFLTELHLSLEELIF